MLYFVVFIIGFALSGIWLACSIAASQILKKSNNAWMFIPLLSAIIQTVIIYVLIGDHPFHFEKLIDYKVWSIGAVTLTATCVIVMFGSHEKDTLPTDDLKKHCVQAACMEIPQRAMMQTFVLWLLTTWRLNPVYCVLITALIWCAGILFQAVIIEKNPEIKRLIKELIASLVFSIGIGYVFYTSGCILLPMAAHASERFLTNYHRKTDARSAE